MLLFIIHANILFLVIVLDNASVHHIIRVTRLTKILKMIWTKICGVC